MRATRLLALGLGIFGLALSAAASTARADSLQEQCDSTYGTGSLSAMACIDGVDAGRKFAEADKAAETCAQVNRTLRPNVLHQCRSLNYGDSEAERQCSDVEYKPLDSSACNTGVQLAHIERAMIEGKTLLSVIQAFVAIEKIKAQALQPVTGTVKPAGNSIIVVPHGERYIKGGADIGDYYRKQNGEYCEVRPDGSHRCY